MRNYLLISFLLTISFVYTACDTPLNEYKPKTDDEKNIIALLDEYTDARNNADLERLQATFHDGGVYISGSGGQFTKEKIMETNPKDWLDNKVKLYDPEFKINGNNAKVTMTAKYGSWKTTHIYSLVNENDNWLIMRVE